MKSESPSPSMTRKNFLRLALAASAAAASAVWLEACQLLGLTATAQLAAPTTTPIPVTPATWPTLTVVPTGMPSATTGPTAVPTATQDPGLVKLALVRTRDRAQGVQQALQLLGLNPVQGKSVLLKPNFNSGDPAPASTSPDTLRALVLALQDMGAGAITVADRSGMGYSPTIMQNLGVAAMAQELGFATLSFEQLTSESEWEMLQPTGSHWRYGFPFARAALDAGAVVQTCCLKPHRFGGHFTLSLKNAVGMVGVHYGSRTYNYMNELHGTADQRLMIAEVNTAYTPALIVLDGVEAFIDQGPDVGTQVWGEAVLAGTDRVAMDAVGLALLRMLGYTGVAAQGPIYQQDQIPRAVELGLGAADPTKIRLLTGDEASRGYADSILSFLQQNA